MKNEALIAVRKAKGFTQEQLAIQLGCAKTSVSNWENGYSTPALGDAFKLAEILDSDVNHLFLSSKVQVSQTIAREHSA